MSTVKVQMQLSCTVKEDKQAHCYVSHCPSLNVYSAGNTEVDALNAIQSALTMYVMALYKRKLLGEKLFNAGFYPSTAQAPGQEFIAVHDDKPSQEIEINVPLELVMNAQAAHAF